VRKDGGNDGPRLAGCWAHSRRRFYELHTAGDSQVATTTVERMADLWKLEAEVRGQSPEARAAARQAISAPIVAELFTLWQQTLPPEAQAVYKKLHRSGARGAARDGAGQAAGGVVPG
jgi:transposase